MNNDQADAAKLNSIDAVNLQKLLKEIIREEESERLNLNGIQISGISIDSRKVKPGNLFLAYPGQQNDGRDYIEMAIQNGAIAIAAEQNQIDKFNIKDLLDDNQREMAKGDACNDKPSKAITIVPVPNLAAQVSRIAGKFYGSPSKKMSLVGVTGTNGKTSVCYLVAQALEFIQKPTLLLSTIGNGSVGSLQTSSNTTSDPLTVQAMAKEFLNNKYYNLCMEVSSHGLDQHRVDGLDYNIAVFTNLSHDHLEYHGDMEAYFQAKRQLFVREELEFVVINADDDYGQRLLNDQQITAKKIAYSTIYSGSSEQDLNVTDQWVTSSNETYSMSGIQADIVSPWGTARINSHLLGDFNLSNLLAVSAILGALTGDVDKWIVALNAAKPVTGRMEQFNHENTATLVVDYAHTPDALEKALKTLGHHCDGELWCVFGCGGDRDPSKRSLMGKVAQDHAQKIIITDDNPRTEDSESIVTMIRQGMTDQKIPYITPRKGAISFALAHAKKEDMVLIAGKGHEDYQEIGNEKLDYSDIQTVEQLLEARA